MMTPGMAPPCWSVTRPVSAPKRSWAEATPAASKHDEGQDTVIMRNVIPPDSLGKLWIVTRPTFAGHMRQMRIKRKRGPKAPFVNSAENGAG